VCETAKHEYRKEHDAHGGGKENRLGFGGNGERESKRNGAAQSREPHEKLHFQVDFRATKAIDECSERKHVDGATQQAQHQTPEDHFKVVLAAQRHRLDAEDDETTRLTEKRYHAKELRRRQVCARRQIVVGVVRHHNAAEQHGHQPAQIETRRQQVRQVGENEQHRQFERRKQMNRRVFEEER